MTKEEINALPDRARAYITDLETMYPMGSILVQENWMYRDALKERDWLIEQLSGEVTGKRLLKEAATIILDWYRVACRDKEHGRNEKFTRAVNELRVLRGLDEVADEWDAYHWLDDTALTG